MYDAGVDPIFEGLAFVAALSMSILFFFVVLKVNQWIRRCL